MSQRPNSVLTEEQVDFFADNGYLHVKNVIEDWELELLQRESAAVIDSCMENRPDHGHYKYCLDPLTGRTVLRRVDYIYSKGDALYALVGHPRILGIAESVFGPNFIYCGGDMVVKVPEYGVPVPWHRDPDLMHAQAFDIDMYLDPATPANGCLHVIPGSHLWQGVDMQDMVDEHGFNLPDAVPVIAEPGDVVLHSPMVLHGSRVTRDKPLRRIVYFAFHTLDEMIRRSWDEDYIRGWVRVMLDAIRFRRGMSETADEIPIDYQPTLPRFRLDAENLGHVERDLPMKGVTMDPNSRYVPHSPDKDSAKE